MDEKRKQLLELIKEMKFPLLPEEAKEHVEKLSEEDMDLLLSTMTSTKNYNDALEEFLRLNAPDEYKRIQKEYRQKLKNINEEHNSKMEGIEKDAVLKMDASDAESERNLDEIVEKELEKADEIGKLNNDLSQKLDSLPQ